MDEYDITVLDVGADRHFKKARQHVIATAHSYALSGESASFLVKRAKSTNRIAGIVLQPTGLLHVMGHGEPDGRIGGERWWSEFSTVQIQDLRAWAEETYEYPKVDGLLLDACDTFTQEWQSQVTALLPPGRKAVMIGTVRGVYWYEGTTYVGGFYSSLLRKPFPQQPGRRRAAILDAHNRASLAYKALLGKVCPYRAVELAG